MTDVIEVIVNGQSVYFEADSQADSETEKVGIGDVGQKAVGTFEDALTAIRAVVSTTVQHIKAFDKTITPDEFSLQFGIKLSGECGAVVTKTAAEAQLAVTVTYKHSNRDTRPKRSMPISRTNY